MNIQTIVVKNFYDKPDKVREYALNCKWYHPYHSRDLINQRNRMKESWEQLSESEQELYERTIDEYTIHQGGNLDWLSTSNASPGNVLDESRYITDENISKLEKLIGVSIDMDHFYTGTKWNGTFQSKLASLRGGKGIHCHIADGNNDCTRKAGQPLDPRYIDKGWAGVVFLTPNYMSFENNGIDIWENRTGLKQSNVLERTGKEWIYHRTQESDMNPNEPYPVSYGEWDMKVRVQNSYNTLVLHPADAYHAGSNGFGTDVKFGRMIQTFFFREKL